MSNDEHPAVDRGSAGDAASKRELGRRGRGPMASRSLRMMLGATVVGAGMWGYAAATRPPETASTAAATGAQVSGGITPRSLTGTSTPAGENALPDVQEVADRAKRLIDESSPAMFRFGLSFVAAFFLGWLLRRFITLTLLVTGAVAAGVIALQRTGVIGIEGDDIRREAERSVGWLQGQAGAIRDVVTGYLPTGFAAILGGYKGFRH